MATLIAQKITDVGVAETLVAATAGGDEFVNSGVEVIHIQNDHSGAWEVTVTAQVTNIHHQQFGTVTKSNIVKDVLPDQSVYIGPFKQSAFNDANQKVQITYEGVTSLKVSVLYLDQQ